MEWLPAILTAIIAPTLLWLAVRRPRSKRDGKRD